jgi:hypothetical protein
MNRLLFLISTATEIESEIARGKQCPSPLKPERKVLATEVSSFYSTSGHMTVGHQYHLYQMVEHSLAYFIAVMRTHPVSDFRRISVISELVNKFRN